MNKEKNLKIAFVHFLYKYTLLWCSSTTSSYDRWPAEKKIGTLLTNKSLGYVAAPDM